MTKLPRRRGMSDRQVAALPKKAKRYIVADPELRGHYVRVPPEAATSSPPSPRSLWQAGVGHARQRRRASRSSRPASRRATAIKRIKAGLPAFEAPPVQPDTVADVCARWLKRHVEAKGLRTGARARSACLRKYVLPHWRDRALHDHQAQRRCRPARHGRGPARRPGWPMSGAGGAGPVASWYATRHDDYVATLRQAACGGSRRRRASAPAR